MRGERLNSSCKNVSRYVVRLIYDPSTWNFYGRPVHNLRTIKPEKEKKNGWHYFLISLRTRTPSQLMGGNYYPKTADLQLTQFFRSRQKLSSEVDIILTSRGINLISMFIQSRVHNWLHVDLKSIAINVSGEFFSGTSTVVRKVFI